jgi:exopolysaccharide production protein ExoQ
MLLYLPSRRSGPSNSRRPVTHIRTLLTGEDAASQIALRLSLNACCILYFGLNLSIPPTLSMGATGVLAFCLIATSRNATAVANRCWPLFVMCGLAMLSAFWSVDPSVTFRRSLQLLFACLLGVAIVGRLGCVEAIRLVIRAMSFACVLCLVWVVLYPSVAIHQATDAAQTVHAGLWRGAFSHKVNYSMFAGLTLGLLLFYGRRSFQTPALFLISVASAIAGLVGSGSATGIVIAFVFLTLLHLINVNAARALQLRRKLVRGLVAFLIFWIVLMTSGALNDLAVVMGRSSDLTGRSTYWPFVMSFLHQGNLLLGYGYAAGYKFVGRMIADDAQLALGEAHNGYIEMLVAFGYAGGLAIIGLHLLLFQQAVQLLLKVPKGVSKVGSFPLALTTILLMTSYIESTILTPAGVFAILLPLSAAVRARVSLQLEQSERHEGARRLSLRERPRTPRQRAIASKLR